MTHHNSYTEHNQLILDELNAKITKALAAFVLVTGAVIATVIASELCSPSREDFTEDTYLSDLLEGLYDRFIGDDDSF